MGPLWTIQRTRTGKAVLCFGGVPTVTLDRAHERARIDNYGEPVTGPELDTPAARARFANEVADAMNARFSRAAILADDTDSGPEGGARAAALVFVAIVGGLAFLAGAFIF